MEKDKPWRARCECPQCGARVELDVGSPLLACPFCRTSLYLCPRGPLTYFMDAARRPRDGDEILIHLPFWRFRGIRYRVLENRIRGTLVDATTPAVGDLPSGATLGIRPQVAPLTLAAHGRRVSPPSIPDQKALRQAEIRIKMMEAERPDLERFIGETQCLIHAPFLLRSRPDGEGGVLEAAWKGASLRHPLAAEAYQQLARERRRPETRVSMRFLTLVCPECAGSLPAVTAAVALVCSGCQRGWRIEGQEYRPLSYRVLRTADPGPGGRFLPFWQLDLQLDGLAIRNRAQLRRTLIPYQEPPDSWETDPVRLFVPAFKLNPTVLVRLAGNITLAPFDRLEETGDFRRGEEAESLRLPLTEAAQAIKIVLCSLFGRNRRLAPKIPGAALQILRADLVFLPFHKRGRDFIEPFSNQSVPAAALRLGHAL